MQAHTEKAVDSVLFGDVLVYTQETEGGIPTPLSSISQDSKNTDLDSNPVNTQIPSSPNSPQEAQVSQNVHKRAERHTHLIILTKNNIVVILTMCLFVV